MTNNYLDKIIPEDNIKFSFLRKMFMPKLVVAGSFFEYAKTIKALNPFCVVSKKVMRKFNKNFQADNFSKWTIVETEGEPTRVASEQLIRKCFKGKHDTLVGIGGGSVLDMVKAIKSSTGLPLIAVPTTPSSGSETTPYILLINETVKSKVLLMSVKAVPDVVILDTMFLETIPFKEMGYFVFDILGHCVEGMVSKMANTFSGAYALAGIEAVSRAVKNIKHPYTKETLELIQNAGFMGGLVQGVASVGLAHSLAHYFGPKYNVPHTKAISLFLPEVVRINASQSQVYEKFQFSNGKGSKSLLNLLKNIKKTFGLGTEVIKVSHSFSQKEAILSIQKDFCAPTNPIRFQEKDFLEVFKHILKYDNRRTLKRKTV